MSRRRQGRHLIATAATRVSDLRIKPKANDAIVSGAGAGLGPKDLDPADVSDDPFIF